MTDEDEEAKKRNIAAAHDTATSIEAPEETALEDDHLAVPQAEGVIDGIAIIAVESARRRMAMIEEEADIPPKSARTAAAVIETHAMIDTGRFADHGAHRDLVLLLDGARRVPLLGRCNAKGPFLLRTMRSHRRRLRGPENPLNNHRWKSKNQISVIRGAWLQRATRSMSMAGRWF